MTTTDAAAATHVRARRAPESRPPATASRVRGGGAESPRVAVVGGGIAGLSAAWALAGAGVHVRLFEQEARLGGAISSLASGPYLVEEGPTTVAWTPALARLVRELRLQDVVAATPPTAHRRYVVRAGRPVAVPTSPAAFATTPLLSVRGKLALLAEPWRRGPRDAARAESVADFARRRLGPEALAYLVDPVVAGVYAGDPRELSLLAAAPAIAAWERRHGSLARGALHAVRTRAADRRAVAGGAGGPDHELRPRGPVSFRGGLSTLVARLGAALGPRVTLGATVRAIRPGADGGWRLAVETGRGRDTVDVDAVIVATPAWAVPQLGWSGELAAAAARVAALPHAPVATLSLAYRRRDVAHPLDGFGALVPSVEGRALLGVLFASTLQAGRCPKGEVLLTAFVGGARQPELAAASPIDVERMVRRDLCALLGAHGAPTFVHHRRWAPGIPQYTAAQPAAVDAAAELEARCPGVRLVGAWRGGVALGAAAASGLAAGDEVAAALARSGESSAVLQ